MHLRSLEIFCDIVRLRSFSQAAANHGVSQPSASQLVHQIEEHLGVVLLDRSTRPLVPTPAGRRYYEGCRAIVQRYKQLEREVVSIDQFIASRLAVASIYSVGLAHMSSYHREFLDRHPDANLKLHYWHPRRVYEAVEAEDVELGLVSYPAKSRHLATTLWRTEPFVIVCSPDNELAQLEKAPIEILRGRKFVAFDGELKIRQEIDNALEARHVEVDTTFEFDNIESIKRAVEIESGVALLPAPTVAREVAGGSLVAIELAGQQLSRPIGIIHKIDRPLSPIAQQFIELLQSHADDPHDDIAPVAATTIESEPNNKKSVHN